MVVDVDQRMTDLTPSHAARIRCLSAITAATTPSSTSLPPRNSSLFSFTSLADKLITHIPVSSLFQSSNNEILTKQRSMSEKPDGPPPPFTREEV
ncbi:hypothetical protein LguiA_014283 [Lonicera macranthoides]